MKSQSLETNETEQTLSGLNSNPLLTVKQASKFLQVNEFTLFRWCLENKLKSVKLSKCRRILQSDLIEFVQNRRKAG